MAEKSKTEKKNQHFVPRFYYRNFSLDADKKYFKVYNVKAGKFIESAKIYDQASLDYYYGEDGRVEDELSVLEAKLAPVISEIIGRKAVPESGSDHALGVCYFVTSMDLRNPLLQEVMVKSLMLELQKEETDIDFSKGKFQNIPQHLLDKFLNTTAQLLVDLTVKLLINKSKTPFISSDFPVVRYNSLVEEKVVRSGEIGWTWIGLEVFIPLNEDCMLMLYDGACYEIGGDDLVSIDKESDVDQLNLLQMVNAYKNVYGGVGMTQSYVDSLAAKANGLRLAARLDDVGNLLALKINLKLSFVKIAADAHNLKIAEKGVFRRPSINPAALAEAASTPIDVTLSPPEESMPIPAHKRMTAEMKKIRKYLGFNNGRLMIICDEKLSPSVLINLLMAEQPTVHIGLVDDNDSLIYQFKEGYFHQTLPPEMMDWIETHHGLLTISGGIMFNGIYHRYPNWAEAELWFE